MADQQGRERTGESMVRSGREEERGLASRQYQDPFSFMDMMFDRMQRDFFGPSLLGSLLGPQPVEGRQEIEIGYHLKRTVWGNGYATEAALACRDYAFAVLNAPRVVSIVSSQNIPSRRVAERVHTALREFFWEKTQSTMCLYYTAQQLAPAE